MAKTRTRVDEITALAAAYLAGQNAKQEDIAERLDIAQASVSRVLRAAEGKYLERTVRFAMDRVPSDKLDKVMRRLSRTQLQEKLPKLVGPEGRVPHVHVFSSESPKAEGDRERRRMTAFTCNAAPFIRELLDGVDSCGIAWGGTLTLLINALEQLRGTRTRTEKLTVVPLCGEGFENPATSTSSSTLAERLDSLLNGVNENRLSLGMVPAHIPHEFTETELHTIWKLIERVEAYTRIFGQHRLPHSHGKKPGKPTTCLVDGLEMIITGLSAEFQPLGFGMTPPLRTHARAAWRELLIGDIAGVCLPRPDLNAAQRRQLDVAEEHWTGLRKEDLLACAKRAATPGTKNIPGVVVLAGGKTKAACVHAALKLGLVNHLVIDKELERALEQLAV